MKHTIDKITQADELARCLEKESQNRPDIELVVDCAGLHNSVETSKARKITSVVAYLFEQYWIISLDFGWVSVFGCVPTFDVYTDKNGHLAIVSREVCLK